MGFLVVDGGSRLEADKIFENLQPPAPAPSLKSSDS